MVIILDVKDYASQIENIGYSESFDWQCQKCGQIHHETEKRNFERRKIKCICQSNDKRAEEINKALKEVNYKFLYNEEQSFTPSNNGKIECKKPIYVQCLKCGKKSYEYYHNIRKGHKKCNCNEDKKFTRELTPQEFFEK